MSDNGGGRPHTIQAHIESLLFVHGNSTTWSPAEVWEGLRERGHEHTVEHVHVALTRLVDRGVIERIAHGTYRLAGALPRVSTIHYVPSSVPCSVSCSMCGGAVEDNDQQKAKHTRFHATWTK